MPKDSQQWLAMFKIALVETNTEMLAMLIEEIPVFQSAKEAESARILSQQAIARLQTLREQTRDSMQQIINQFMEDNPPVPMIPGEETPAVDEGTEV